MNSGPCSKIMVLALFFRSSFLFFSSSFHGDFPFLYSLLEVIRALHLLIIWTLI